MINILFWNAKASKKTLSDGPKEKERIENNLISLIIERRCDIVVLAEYDLDLNALCNKISLHSRDFKIAAIAKDTRVKLIIDTKFKLELLRDSAYYFIYNIKCATLEFLLSGVHLQSKLHATNADREMVAGDLIYKIQESEELVKHKNVIIVGDFNADPFEDVMVKGNMMHAIPFADIVIKKQSRKVAGKKYQMFYNPMWNFFGDLNFPYGTFYYDAGGSMNFYHNIFDQAIFSANMTKHLDRENIKIIDSIKNCSLMDCKGNPNQEMFSDHLPIFFQIKEETV